MSIFDLDAYEMVKQEDLTGIKSKGYVLRHKKTGARFILIENDDENKVFSIAFRTPPTDSTGVPHIMEHSVLCGSKNFPVKDPFVELAKGSLNTFLNAMTFPDKTAYPVASCNDKDFQNLMHVYMDAVLYPNIYKYDEIFRQEGWSYRLDDPEGKLTYNGVVYNEMKGAFSSPEEVLSREILNNLFPDTPYAWESGGDPDVIPSLTYEQFLDFHRKYYHPSNSYIYLYGDMDMEEKLRWLDGEYLSKFGREDIDSGIPLQKPFDRMKDISDTYSVAADEPLKGNTYLSYNKAVGTMLDEKLYLAFQVLDYVLLSAPGAALKKALTDAGIGKDIMGYYDNSVLQPIFSVTAKNADEDQKDAFVKVIEDTLKKTVRDGLDKKAIEAGINYYEFRFREADFGGAPKGLIYGLEVIGSALYDDEKPFIHIKAIPTFEFLKAQKDTGYFERLIQKYLLDNTHGCVITLKPERGRAARLDRELEERLQNYKSNLKPEEIEKLIKNTKRLKEYQESEETLEDLEKIPLLDVSDISKDIAPVYNEEINASGVKILYHEIETNGIGYVTLMFDLSKVPEERLAYVGVLASVLGLIDTKEHGYGELSNEINMHTGGVSTSLEIYSDVNKVKEKEFKATFEMKGKALYPKMGVLLSLMREILMDSALDDTKRIKEILSMLKSKLQMFLMSSGHIAASVRALSYSSPQGKFKDDTSGIGFYQAVKDLDDNFDKYKDEIVSNLTALAASIFRRDNLIISYTSAKEGLAPGKDAILRLTGSLNKETAGQEASCVLHCRKRNEGFKTSSKVQYVARTGNFIDRGEEYRGALRVLKVILSYDYLWQNLRVKGGAYGCGSSFNRFGDGYFTSFRDPHLKRTNEVYEGVVDYLKNFTGSARDMNKYIIGTMSEVDRPLTPPAKGERSMNLYMCRVTREMIQKERLQILSTSQEDIRSLADVVQAVLDEGSFCVIGAEDKIEEAKDMFYEVNPLF